MIPWFCGGLQCRTGLQFQTVIDFVVPLSIFEAQWSVLRGRQWHSLTVSHPSCSLDLLLVRGFGCQLSPGSVTGWGVTEPPPRQVPCSGGAEGALEAVGTLHASGSPGFSLLQKLLSFS